MRGKSIRRLLLPVLLAVGLGACANNAVPPGIVSTSGSSVASAPPYGNSQTYGNQGYGNAQSYASAQPGESGRVVSINDVSLRGGGGGGGSNGPGNGTMVGGLLGGLGGIAIGASGGRGLGGGLIGGVLGAVGGAIAGTIIENHTNIGGGGRGIEVTVQKDNGQTVTVAQRDDGDVQLGDRVQVVQDRSGTAKVVRDNGRQPDYGQPPQSYQPAPQDYRTAGNYPPPQDYRQAPPQGSGGYGGNYGPPPQGSGGYGNYGPPSQQDYRQAGYSRPQSTTYTPIGGGQYQEYPRGNPQPGDDPRYGTIQ